ncbi:hypothetical protein C8J57DRAFT_1364574 [Mycena rebaudengoi]|nr:hypothetical protein C8J57DRAFT_1364574 [Mycena rebaudengoi]
MYFLVPSQVHDLLDGPVPSLRVLWLGLSLMPGESDSFDEVFYDGNPSRTLFRDSPNLKMIGVTAKVPSVVSLPWAQLTTFEGTLWDFQCLPLLREATNLVHCTLHLTAGYVGYLPVPALPPLPPLHHLQTLFLADTTTSNTWAQMRILPALTFPALRVLEVSKRPYIDSPCAVVKSLISRSNCTLKELRITHVHKPASFYQGAFPDIEIITLVA